MHALSTRGEGRSTTYQSCCACLCTGNDFPGPPVLSAPSYLHAGRNKKRIVRVGEQLRGWREEQRTVLAYRKQTSHTGQRAAATSTPPLHQTLFPVLTLPADFFPHIPSCPLQLPLMTLMCIVQLLNVLFLFLSISISSLAPLSFCEMLTLASEASLCLPHRRT